MTGTDPVAEAIQLALEQYFADLEGARADGLYDMVISSVEKSMLQVVMNKAQGNQSLAAQMLGINRNTLRRKLAAYKLL